MFLAVLELVRRFEVQFDQESSGPITLRLRDDQKDVVCEVEIASDEDAAPPQ